MSTNNPHLAPRTIREWLDLIPFDRARKEAIENYDPKMSVYPDEKVESLSVALDSAFWFYKAPQGRIYWMRIWSCVYHMEKSVKLKNKA